jgi:hypothetical protein
LAELTQKDRKTIRYLLANLKPEPGPRGAKLYPSNLALETIYLGSEGAITNAEAVRQLNIVKKEQIELQNQVTRGKYYERDAVHFLYEHIFRMVTGTLKGNLNRVLSFDVVNEIFEAIRNGADDLQAQGDELWTEYEKEMQTKEGVNGSGVAPGTLASNRRGNDQSIPATG